MIISAHEILHCIYIVFFLFSCYSFGGGFTITKNKEYAIYIRQRFSKAYALCR